jgi:hypothetical protein
MAASWHNFLYCAFDPAGFISVDKPPVALWIQVASVKALRLPPASLIYPQVIAGVACVGLVYAIVRRDSAPPPRCSPPSSSRSRGHGGGQPHQQHGQRARAGAAPRRLGAAARGRDREARVARRGEWRSSESPST